MNEKELLTYVQKLSLKYFKAEFKHRVIWNPRFKSTGGRYHLSDHHLDFNPKVLEYLGEEEFRKVVLHELCHYHLHLRGMGYRHRDADFKRLLQAVGGSRFVPNMESKEMKYRYRCQDCGCIYPRQRKVNVKKFCCGKCKGRLEFIAK